MKKHIKLVSLFFSSVSRITLFVPLSYRLVHYRVRSVGMHTTQKSCT